MATSTTTLDASAKPNERILMVVRDDSRDQDLMLQQEAFVMRDLIEAAGYDVDVVTVNDEPLLGEVSLHPDLTLAEVKLTNYVGLILPCMAAEPQKAMPEKIVRLVERAQARALPMGAMRGSVRELARAGVLAGRRYAYATQVDLDANPEFRGATYTGTGVTTDNGVSTAGICPLAAKVLDQPDATTELTQAFLTSVSDRP